MRVLVVAPGVLLAGVGLGGVVTVVTLLPGPVGLAAAIGVLCAGAFLLLPWPSPRYRTGSGHGCPTRPIPPDQFRPCPAAGGARP